MFDVLAPIGICVMWLLRSLTPYSGAVSQKQVFRLDEASIFGFFADPETTPSSHVFSRLLVRAALPVLPRTFEDLDFLSWNASTTWTHIVSLRGAKWNVHALCASKPCELARSPLKTSRTGPTFVPWRMSVKFKRTSTSVPWRISVKFKRTYSSVAWHMSAKFKRSYDSVAWRTYECKVQENLQ